MTFPGYLAFTTAELENASVSGISVAWMACHFSCYSTGLSNCPDALPKGAMLIVNDRTPPQGHDPERIAIQLKQLTERLPVSGVLLDLQRTDAEENQAIAEAVVPALSCPVGVSAPFAKALSCPVFLPPVPVNRCVKDHIAPWEGREIWLDVDAQCRCFTVTQTGCQVCCSTLPAQQAHIFQDENLCCHYCAQTHSNSVDFTLWRTREDICNLLQQAAVLGVQRCIGLYQELRPIFFP